jgi:hypothetical protein
LIWENGSAKKTPYRVRYVQSTWKNTPSFRRDSIWTGQSTSEDDV